MRASQTKSDMDGQFRQVSPKTVARGRSLPFSKEATTYNMRLRQATPQLIRRGKVLLKELVQIASNGKPNFLTKKFGSIDTNIPTHEFDLYKKLVSTKSQRPLTSYSQRPAVSGVTAKTINLLDLRSF